MMKITVIGAGNMGGAMIKGFVKSGQVEVTATDKCSDTLDKLKADFPAVKVGQDNVEAVKDADIIVVAVKPWLVGIVAEEIKEAIDLKKQIVVSVAANVLTANLVDLFAKEMTGAPIFYAIPNIAAEFGQSMTFVAPAEGASQDDANKVETALRLIGSVKMVSENLVASGMMMSGCGIAYVMRYIRAMMEGGVEMGFYAKDAQEIAQQTMKGAVALLENTGLHPESAIDKVTTPGGVTIKGLNELDHSGFNSAVINGLKAGLK